MMLPYNKCQVCWFYGAVYFVTGRFFKGQENEGETEEGTYFVDQAGLYYYQAKGESQPVMTVMTGLPESGGDEKEEFIINPHNDGDMEVEEGEEVYFISEH